MKSVILEELAKTWELEVESDRTRDGSPEAELSNAKQDGFNDGMVECAKRLKAVIGLFG